MWILFLFKSVTDAKFASENLTLLGSNLASVTDLKSWLSTELVSSVAFGPQRHHPIAVASDSTRYQVPVQLKRTQWQWHKFMLSCPPFAGPWTLAQRPHYYSLNTPWSGDLCVCTVLKAVWLYVCCCHVIFIFYEKQLTASKLALLGSNVSRAKHIPWLALSCHVPAMVDLDSSIAQENNLAGLWPSKFVLSNKW